MKQSVPDEDLKLLEELLQRYEGALILVLRDDGRVTVFSGAVNGENYRDLIAETPGATEKWAQQAMKTLHEKEAAAPSAEMN